MDPTEDRQAKPVNRIGQLEPDDLASPDLDFFKRNPKYTSSYDIL